VFRLSAWPGWQQNVTHLVAEKPVFESKHQLRPGPADLHLIVGRFKLGGKHMFMSDWSALMIPQNATLNSKRTLS
jgi:hypothetical protein